MKLFQRLLVAPAALGLLAPLSATAAELNITDVNSYSNGEVTSISDFSEMSSDSLTILYFLPVIDILWNSLVIFIPSDLSFDSKFS